MKRESEIESYLIKKAKKYNILFYKFLSFQKGVPDRMLIGLNRVVFAECKSEKGGVLSPLQKKRIKELKEKNIEVYIIDSFEKADELIESFIEYRTHKEKGDGENGKM